MSNSPSIDSQTHETAVRLAVQCRRIIQACLREEEWVEADREFYEVIRDGLRLYQSERDRCTPDTS